MPPLPSVPKVLKTALSGAIGTGDVWLTRFYTQYTGTAPSVADLTAFNNAVEAAWVAHLQSLTDTQTFYNQTETIDLSSPTSSTSISAVSRSGSESGQPNPAQICAVISYSIARRYRGGHPRGYWRCGVQANLGDPGHWGSGFVSSLETGIGAFFVDVAAAGWSGAGTLTHVNVSYFSGFTVVVNPITGRARNVPTLRGTPLVDPILTLIVRTQFGTQRRREAFLD